MGILAIGSALAGQVQGQSYLTNGLVAYYPFNGNAADQFDRGNTGILENGAFYTNGIDGEPSSAVYCDGVNGYVLFGKNDALYPNQVLTWAVWFKAEALTGVIFWDDDSQAGGDRGICLSASAEVSQPGSLYGGGFFTGQFIQSTNAPVTLFQWQQAVFTSAGNGQRLYLDGSLIASTNVIIAGHAGRSSVSVGAGNFTNSNNSGPNFAYDARFKGAISKVRIYNRALSASEVQELYQQDLPPPRTATATATVVNGFVVGATVTDVGYGYTNTPTVRIIGGGGSGAQSVAVMTNGAVIAVNALSTGYGYTSTPIIVIEPPFIPQPTMRITALFFGPLVTPVLEFDLANLSPYDNYQLEFSPTAGESWSSVGTPFSPTTTTSTQHVSASGSAGFFRVKYLP